LLKADWDSSSSQYDVTIKLLILPLSLNAILFSLRAISRIWQNVPLTFYEPSTTPFQIHLYYDSNRAVTQGLFPAPDK
jgi:hypothetical protein